MSWLHKMKRHGSGQTKDKQPRAPQWGGQRLRNGVARAAGPRPAPRVRARALMSVGMDEALWQSVVSSFAARAARRGDIETGCVQRDTGKLVCRQSVALPFPLPVQPCPNLPGNLVTYRLGKDKRPLFASVIPLGYLITKRPWCRGAVPVPLRYAH